MASSHRRPAHRAGRGQFRPGGTGRRQEDYEAALAALREGRQVWQASSVYAQIFFRHPDLDSLQEAFAALEQLLRQEDRAWPAALELLRYHLQTLNRMEHVSPGTVF